MLFYHFLNFVLVYLFGIVVVELFGLVEISDFYTDLIINYLQKIYYYPLLNYNIIYIKNEHKKINLKTLYFFCHNYKLLILLLKTKTDKHF